LVLRCGGSFALPLLLIEGFRGDAACIELGLL
jgi:hypothetical protein